MIKILRNISFVLLTSMVFFGCEEEQTVYSGPEFVRFTTTSLTLDESMEGETFTVDIHLVGKAAASETALTITTAGTAVEGEDFAFISSKTPSIPAGDFFTSIEFEVFDNDDLDGARSLIFIISEAGSYEVGYGGDSTDYAIGESFTVGINDDDFWCPRNILAGSITTGTDVGYSSGDVSIVPAASEAEGCLTFTLVGGASPLFGSEVNFDISLEEDGELSNTGTVLDASGLELFTSSGGVSTYTLDIAEGVYSGEDNYYDLEAGAIGFDYNFNNPDGSLYFSGRLEYCNGTSCPN